MVLSVTIDYNSWFFKVNVIMKKYFYKIKKVSIITLKYDNCPSKSPHLFESIADGLGS